MTIDSPELITETFIKIDSAYERDEFILKDQPEVRMNKRIQRVIDEAREYAHLVEGVGFLPCYAMRIVSKNTVPTASGLASSASGIAALAYGLIELYDLENQFEMKELSKIARLGSGSACRSLFGGLVHWSGETVERVGWWPGLNGYVILLNDQRKKVSSSEGMNRTVRTSSLFYSRVEEVVPERIRMMLDAIKTKNFEIFAELSMKDSNCFHACCLDSFPPISYLTAESFEIIEAVHEYNAKVGKIVIGYTFDAGPNAVIFGIDQDPETFIAQLLPKEYKTIKWKLGKGPQVISRN